MGYLKGLFSIIFLLLLICTNTQASDGRYITLDQAVAEMKKDTRLKVLDAETVDFNGKKVHQIKILTHDGYVKKINVRTQSD